ncbi:hypothetical protein [Microbacterium sp.]|uniref:hypothetical protein n=1 Tax=Microbacterium sp. TaxID=51671 RepID=UPI0039E709E6
MPASSTSPARPPAAASVVALLVVALAACAPSAPATVVAGTRVVVAWPGELTSLNALADPTAGNLDIAAATRDDFGAVVDGEFVADPGFGTVSIVGDDPFTVRYDLAEPSWSDGTPLDAADLLLGWAAATGILDLDGDPDGGPDAAHAVPTVDEFARAIEVTFPQPTIGWQTAVSAQVPAHIVGRLAFGEDDAMQAKQSVIRAIEDDDATALAAIAEAWHSGFDVGDGTGLSADLLVSSGPYQVGEVSGGIDGQSVTLVPNAGYRGAVTAQVAQIDLVPSGDDPIAAIGDTLDVAQVAPTAENRAPIHELERLDSTAEATNDGSVWTVRLRPAGVFAGTAARAAFLRMAPVNDLIDRGAGEWASAYAKTTSVVAVPGSRAYDIVAEDSGFTAALGTPADDAALDREAAGIPAGTAVCVLYDRGSAFAAGAFAALRDAAAEAGWAVADCGSDDLGAAVAAGGWDALIDRTPVPLTPARLAEQWGSAAGLAPPDADRDDLIAQLAQTVDVYQARELLGEIEASIVRAAVVRPLAMNPVVTVVDRGVTGVAARNSPASLTWGVAHWAVVP